MIKRILSNCLTLFIAMIVFVLVAWWAFPTKVGNVVLGLMPPAKMIDSTYVYSKEKFIKQIRVIHGYVNVKDSCSYGFGNNVGFCSTLMYKLITTATIKYYVDVDTSKIQINNSSKTLMIDARNPQLKIEVQNFDMRVSPGQRLSTKCFSLTAAQIENCRQLCKADFRKHIPELYEIVEAKKSLEETLNQNFIYIINKGTNPEINNEEETKSR